MTNLAQQLRIEKWVTGRRDANGELTRIGDRVMINSNYARGLVIGRIVAILRPAHHTHAVWCDVEIEGGKIIHVQPHDCVKLV